MGVSVQPSILTVCVPGSASDLGSLEFRELLAARKRAAAASSPGHRAMSVLGRGERAKADAAQGDPACAIDGVCESSQGLARVDEPGSPNVNRMFVGGSMSCGESGCGESGCGEAGCGESLSESVDASDESASCGPSFFHADSGKKALELMRILRFDLLVTGDRLPDMPVGHLIRRVRVAWPWQKWAMVGSAISAQDEIAARSLGAMAVFDAPADWQLLGSLAATAAGRTTPILDVEPAFPGGHAQNTRSSPAGSSRQAALKIESSDTRIHNASAPRTSARSSKFAAGKRSAAKGAVSRQAGTMRQRTPDRSVG